MKVANVSFAELISGMDIIGAYKKANT